VPLCPPQIPPDLGSNPGHRSGKPATNCLSYGTAKMHPWFSNWFSGKKSVCYSKNWQYSNIKLLCVNKHKSMQKWKFKLNKFVYLLSSLLVHPVSHSKPMDSTKSFFKLGYLTLCGPGL
jgi:hypothetical protein